VSPPPTPPTSGAGDPEPSDPGRAHDELIEALFAPEPPADRGTPAGSHEEVAGSPAPEAEWDDRFWHDPSGKAPEHRSRWRTAAWVLGAAVAILVVVGGVGAWWFMGQVDPGDPGEQVSFTVPEGSSTSDIATLLEAEGVVGNATVFQLYTRWKGAGPYLAGTYGDLRQREAMDVVVERLEAGPLPPATVPVAVPEGLWLTDVRDLILEQLPAMEPAALDAALATVRSPFQPEGADLEGLLFPATYEVVEGAEADAEGIVRQMVAKFDEVAAAIGLADAPARLEGVAGDRTITPYEAVIVASMIEEETSIDAERPMVARVIYNRLARGERLGIDATVLYAIGEHKEQITQSDLDTDSPYNTRLNTGLPPGPISSPGQASLEAALNPAEGSWRYYVLAESDGTHFFTDDYDEFLRVAQESRDRGIF
jgi:UPF0755 protein